MVRLENVTRSFGKKSVFSDISFSLSHGEICGLVGLNGVGKTTLLRIIAGTLQCNGGTITVLGSNPGVSGSFYRKLGVVLDCDGFNGNLSFIENLKFYSRIKQLQKDDVETYIEKYWCHLAAKKVPVKNFSRGERMQCGLARGFLGSPELLLLDEPASNLDSEGYKLLCQLVTDSKSNGATAIISSHRLDTITQLCDSVAFLDHTGLTKISLDEIAVLHWCMRGKGMLNVVPVIESLGGTIEKRTTEEITFKNIEKEQIPTILNKVLSSDVAIHECFLRDPVVVATENHRA